MNSNFPTSCDTFVCLPPFTKKNVIIFGKNSDRPADEVQEVVYYPGKSLCMEKTVQCTYICIPQVSSTNSVILSKPAWMWGAEMGANEHDVCIGNEAVWTKYEPEKTGIEKLLGMDLVRLGLERANSGEKAVKVIGALLEQFGQGGRCFESSTDCTEYHNSFMIVDKKEAWVMDTSGNAWVAQRVKGMRNMSNQVSIGAEADLKSRNVEACARKLGWRGDKLNFCQVFSAEPEVMMEGKRNPGNRLHMGRYLLEKLTAKPGVFDIRSMMSILRDTESGICMDGHFGSLTTASMISVIYPDALPPCHWFTATPNPACSIFKPFIFTANVVPTLLTNSPNFGESDPARLKPRFKSKVIRSHPLYAAHSKIKPVPGTNADANILSILHDLEERCIQDIDTFYDTFSIGSLEGADELFKNSVETEMKCYAKC